MRYYHVIFHDPKGLIGTEPGFLFPAPFTSIEEANQAASRFLLTELCDRVDCGDILFTEVFRGQVAWQEWAYTSSSFREFVAKPFSEALRKSLTEFFGKWGIMCVISESTVEEDGIMKTQPGGHPYVLVPVTPLDTPTPTE